jgi:hypothetical protein
MHQSLALVIAVVISDAQPKLQTAKIGIGPRDLTCDADLQAA